MSESPRLCIELLGEDAHGLELPATGTLIVGCSRERAGFVVDGPGVDQVHCAIGRGKEGDWVLKDLGSRQGTLLNGQRVSGAKLKLGDQIVLGSRRLELRAARTEAARAALGSLGSARPADVPPRIGGYRVERLLGRGGMGAVYLAVQESLRRPVALKVLAPELAADGDFVQRFQAEARAAAALSHPNVVVVYDVGEEGGSHYLSMEFMAGGSLEQKLAASGPLPWKTVLGVLHDAAAGLSYAESRGIVHRDIKPANLMYSGTGTVKIADLGLATTIEQEASEAVDGRRVYGTPHFISPEQARGEAVDHRSDLYSLGATVYRLLSGKTPFEGATTRDILRALQSEEPRPLRDAVRGLPADLEALIARLMAKDPADRPPGAESLRRECERLRLVAEHGTVLEPHAGRSRVQFWIGAGLLCVLLATAGVWAYLQSQAPESPVSRGMTAADLPAQLPEDRSFFEDVEPESAAPTDEERALRERERLAGEELRALSKDLPRSERYAALLGIVERYPGTAAATAASAERALLSTGSLFSDTPPSPEDPRITLTQRLHWPLPEGELPRPGALLSELDTLRPPSEPDPAFDAARATLAAEVIAGAESYLRARYAEADALAQGGDFARVRTLLADLAPVVDGLASVPGDPARLSGLKALSEELAQRRARVDEDERRFHEGVERARNMALAASVGPNSGLLDELVALDVAAVEKRLASLPPDLAARPLPAQLAEEVALTRRALASLQREFAAGSWRRKSLIDPRSKKVREVRDVRPEGLVFEKDAGLETVPWSEAHCDPVWWNQVFQARLTRDWSAEDASAIVALLRLMGAARGADIAREMLDPRRRGFLQPAEIEALRGAFAPAVQWMDDSGQKKGALREALEKERVAAAWLADVLASAQNHAWSQSSALLERLLSEARDTLLVGLLSDGGEWREPRAPLAAASSGTGSEAPK